MVDKMHPIIQIYGGHVVPYKIDIYARISVYRMPEVKITKEMMHTEEEQPHLSPVVFGSFILLKIYELQSMISNKKNACQQMKIVAGFYVIKN
jgi:hypothetical protein